MYKPKGRHLNKQDINSGLPKNISQDVINIEKKWQFLLCLNNIFLYE